MYVRPRLVQDYNIYRDHIGHHRGSTTMVAMSAVSREKGRSSRSTDLPRSSSSDVGNEHSCQQSLHLTLIVADSAAFTLPCNVRAGEVCLPGATTTRYTPNYLAPQVWPRGTHEAFHPSEPAPWALASTPKPKGPPLGRSSTMLLHAFAKGVRLLFEIETCEEGTARCLT